MKRRLVVLVAVLSTALVACGDSETEGPAPLDRDRHALLDQADEWMYQIGYLDENNAVGILAATDYPMLVLEPGHNDRPCSDSFQPTQEGSCANRYDTAAMLQELRTTPDGHERLLIAYIDIGQAEVYRDYWTSDWGEVGADENPSFILGADPDGWAGNYVVAYWDPAWKQIWLGSAESPGIIAELAAFGFDGIYLDWVEAYDDGDYVEPAAAAAGVDPAEEMVLFVAQLRDRGRETIANFLVIAQNATFLIDEFSDPARYASVIDALAVEDTWYYGNGATEDWNDGTGVDGGVVMADRLDCEATKCCEQATGQDDCADPLPIVAPDNVCPMDAEYTAELCVQDTSDNLIFPVSGDLHGGLRHRCPPGTEGLPDCWSTENRLAAYDRYLDAGVPVFTVDYCITEDKAREVYEAAWARELRPLVTRVQLSQNTETPPWDF